MELSQLSILSGALTVFQNLMKRPLYQALRETIGSLQTDASAFCSNYARLTAQLYENGAIGDALYAELHYDENILTEHLRLHKTPSAALLAGVDADLNILSALSLLTGPVVKAAAQIAFPKQAAAIGFLPDFPTGKKLPLQGHADLIALYRSHGYGYFARGSAFSVEDGALRMIAPPEITLSDLKGYAWQKKAILENTAAFLHGEEANNILLYGDKGCGKSSTVKAIARAFAPEGLKIIAFPAKEVVSFGKIYSLLEKSPYRFILFMDDLSFEKETAEFVALKAFMEGGMAEKTKNALVYATSNRRHLIKESFSERQGDDVNIRETLETQTSLSDRFGMEIVFSVPDKAEYLAIVDALAEEQGIMLAKAALHNQAEIFALRKNGRSPRTARQFINSLIAKEKS